MADNECATILVVEDDPVLRGMTREFLLAVGYTVLEAADGKDALRLCEQEAGRIDLLITDVMMPGLSGRELAERVAATWPEIGLIMMSGYVSDVLVRQGILKEARFLQKPFTLEALAGMVRGALQHARSTRPDHCPVTGGSPLSTTGTTVPA